MRTDIQLRLRIFLLFLFHFFGIIACLFEVFHPLFKVGTPYHLIAINLILFYDTNLWKGNFPKLFVVAFLIGLVSEMIGVNTGWLFGNYQYSSALGVKLLGVPLLIGFTWVGTAFACNVLVQKWNTLFYLKALAAAALMLLFDLLLEQFATAVPLWTWENGIIPLYNYFCWFVVGYIISLLFQKYAELKYSPVAFYFLFTQLLFFMTYLYLGTQAKF